MNNQRFAAAIAQGRRPVPFRTRKLRPGTAMVLHPTGCGRVARRRTTLQRRGDSPKAASPPRIPGDTTGRAPRLPWGLPHTPGHPPRHHTRSRHEGFRKQEPQDDTDDEGEVVNAWENDLKLLFNGAYSTFIPECLFRLDAGGELASMILCTEFKSLPLAAYAATLPKSRNRGYARFLLRKVLGAAQRMGYEGVSLVVTDGNDAVIKAYQDAGFKAKTDI